MLITYSVVISGITVLLSDKRTQMHYPVLFSPASIGKLTLKNRAIRSAAFEGMCPGNRISDDLISYHQAVAAGGTAMTTVAYAAVSRSGLSFPHQLLIDPSGIPAMRKLTTAVHSEGAAVALQIGHCGQMADRRVAGDCFSPSGGINLYGPTWPRKMNESDILTVVKDFGKATRIAVEAGFDAMEVHAGHGYLISQFLSPYTNKRTDAYGGTFENRCRFLTEVIREVKENTCNRISLIVKMNMRDGFRGGMEMDESLKVASLLEKEGAEALVLSGGFVSKAPMYVMRGAMPIAAMARYMANPLMRTGTRMFAPLLIKPQPFREAYFLEDALKVRQVVKIPLIYVGGLKTGAAIESVLSQGFEFVQVARALIQDPAFIGKLKTGEATISGCHSSNFCIAHMYSGKMVCYQHHPEVPEKWREKFRKNH